MKQRRIDIADTMGVLSFQLFHLNKQTNQRERISLRTSLEVLISLDPIITTSIMQSKSERDRQI